DPVLLPTQSQLKAIIESGNNRRVNIGTSPLAGNAIVSVDPDRIFGRHLAVLGNTGSGKSCSVAGLLRWSIEAAKKHQDSPNNRFIVLDPNGEYTNSFKGLANVRVYGAEPNEEQGIKQLIVPMWLWNTAEWVAFTQASGKAQKPTLVQALRCVRDGSVDITNQPETQMRRYLGSLITLNQLEITNGTPWTGGGKSRGNLESLRTWRSGIENIRGFNTNEQNALESLSAAFQAVIDSNMSNNSDWPKYPQTSVDQLQQSLISAHTAFGGTDK